MRAARAPVSRLRASLGASAADGMEFAHMRRQEVTSMGRAFILWLLGVPASVLLVLWLIGFFH